MSINFGITEETRVTSATPILVAKKVENDARFPNGWAFPIARLVNVVSKENHEKQDGSLTDTLQFIFADADKRQHIHTEYKLEENDEKFEVKLGGLQARVGHIYQAVFGKSPVGLGAGAKSFYEFFKAVEEAFNSKLVEVKGKEGDVAKNIKEYTRISLYIKVVYYKSRLNFPLSPNFVEKVIENKPCLTLKINPSDQTEPTKTPKGIPGVGGGATSNGGMEVPVFDGGFTG